MVWSAALASGASTTVASTSFWRTPMAWSPCRWALTPLADFQQAQRQQFLQDAFDRAGLRQEWAADGRSARTSRRFHPSCRQFNPALLLQLEQQGARRHIFELTVGRAPVPQPGQFATEPITAPTAVLADQGLDLRQLFRTERSALQHRRQLHHRRVWQKGKPEFRTK